MRAVSLSIIDASFRVAISLYLNLKDYEADMDALEDTVATTASFRL